jgi:predicted nucleic acid-binding protein
LSALVDTDVLVHATRSSVDAAAKDKRRDCRTLLQTLDPVVISVITYTELVPYLTDPERKSHAGLLDKFDQRPFGPLEAQLASKLIAKHRSAENVCQRCFGVKTADECQKCGLRRSRGARLNDFYIAATGAIADDIDTIYTYDFLYLNQYLRGKVEIQRPRNASGPLFEGEGAS